MNPSECIKKLQSAGLTQTQIADKIGMSQSQVSKLAAGKHVAMRWDKFQLLLRAAQKARVR